MAITISSNLKTEGIVTISAIITAISQSSSWADMDCDGVETGGPYIDIATLDATGGLDIYGAPGNEFPTIIVGDSIKIYDDPYNSSNYAIIEVTSLGYVSGSYIGIQAKVTYTNGMTSGGTLQEKVAFGGVDSSLTVDTNLTSTISADDYVTIGESSYVVDSISSTVIVVKANIPSTAIDLMIYETSNLECISATTIKQDGTTRTKSIVQYDPIADVSVIDYGESDGILFDSENRNIILGSYASNITDVYEESILISHAPRTYAGSDDDPPEFNDFKNVVSIGYVAGGFGSRTVAIGYYAGGSSNDISPDCIFIGSYTGNYTKLNSTGAINIGKSSGRKVDEQGSTVLIGTSAARQGSNSKFENMTCVGAYTFYAGGSGNHETDYGTYLGARAGISSTGNNNLCVGYNAGSSGSPGGVLEGNAICLGDSSITRANIKVSWTVSSDERDKADIEEMTHGLDVIKNINPISYFWDTRSAYDEQIIKEVIVDEITTLTDEQKRRVEHTDITKEELLETLNKDKERDEEFEIINHPRDGSKKITDDRRTGFSAQNLKEALDSVGYEGHSVVDSRDSDKYKVTETNIIPFLVNAVKELSKEIEDLKSKI